MSGLDARCRVFAWKKQRRRRAHAQSTLVQKQQEKRKRAHVHIHPLLGMWTWRRRNRKTRGRSAALNTRWREATCAHITRARAGAWLEADDASSGASGETHLVSGVQQYSCGSATTRKNACRDRCVWCAYAWRRACLAFWRVLNINPRHNKTGIILSRDLQK
jgi:hypothetical protein